MKNKDLLKKGIQEYINLLNLAIYYKYNIKDKLIAFIEANDIQHGFCWFFVKFANYSIESIKIVNIFSRYVEIKYRRFYIKRTPNQCSNTKEIEKAIKERITIFENILKSIK